MVGKFVIVRTSGAGVHCGTVAEINSDTVRLTDARRIWRWRGANTLHELSLRGAAQDYTRISEPVAEIVVNGAHEIIACDPAAVENLRMSRWGE